MNDPYLIGFSRAPRMTPVRFKRIQEAYASFEQAWEELDEYELMELTHDATWAHDFCVYRSRVSLERELARLHELGVMLISPTDKLYPIRLAEIYTPPPWLYVRGELKADDLIAIVGTRKITDYTKQATIDITSALVHAGVTVVSGLAFGIDAEAHRTVLQSNGKTIAVLGSGVNLITPTEHTNMAEEIVQQGGAIISEFPLDMPAERYHFPQRNRIISGLSRATIVIGAAKKSGALITAYCALEQNRDVYALPGNLYQESSAGCNALIRQGAGIICSTESLLEDLNLLSGVTPVPLQLNLQEGEVLAALTAEPRSIDELVILTKFSIPDLSSILTTLELKGAIRQTGLRYTRVR